MLLELGAHTAHFCAYEYEQISWKHRCLLLFIKRNKQSSTMQAQNKLFNKTQTDQDATIQPG